MREYFEGRYNDLITLIGNKSKEDEETRIRNKNRREEKERNESSAKKGATTLGAWGKQVEGPASVFTLTDKDKSEKMWESKVKGALDSS